MRSPTLLAVARSILLLIAVSGAIAQAQELPDAGLPDASVGQGGADMTNEENDMGAPCLDTNACTGATRCVNGRCVPVRPTELGCTAAGPGLWALPLLGLWLRRR